MPYIRVDPETYDEIVEELDGEDLPNGLGERPSGDFEYEAAAERFEPADLGEASRLTLAALRDMGATGFRVRYDGGYDEGFSHPEAVLFDLREGSIDAVAADLAAAGFADRLRADPKLLERYVYYLKPDSAPATVAKTGLDELAHDLASKLLGDGYGTGEYELYGAFTADLRTGDLTDDPDATKPDTREW